MYNKIPMDENLSKVAAHHNWWSATYDSDISSMHYYNKVTWDNVQRFLPSDKSSLILDAGGGTGFWAVRLAQLGYHVILTDISDGMLDKAREKVSALALEDRVEVCVSDIRHMPEFADAQFDMVLCEGDPLSYCGDHYAAVREFARVLRKNGTVIASVDNRASAVNWFKDADDLDAIAAMLETGDLMLPEREEFRYNVHAFTASELQGLFESNGLKVERIIGKPVISHRLAIRGSDDPGIQNALLQLELKYCDDPAFYPQAGHLEIAARKL